MTRAVRSWVTKAEADYRFAVKNLNDSKGYLDLLAFHFQQAGEKYLKALMEHRTVTIVRTHNLSELVQMLLPHDPSLGKLQRGMRFLTRFAVNTRYPGDNVSKRQVIAAYRWAERVRLYVRTTLKLKG